MSSSYDHEALWFKAKLFLNWAFEDGEHRTFDERALWASMALELLAKAALSKVSPLLIAVPTEEGANILIAAGLISGDARFESIRARTLFKRCARAYKPFSDTDGRRGLLQLQQLQARPRRLRADRASRSRYELRSDRRRQRLRGTRVRQRLAI